MLFTSPKNDVLETKCGKIYKHFNDLKAILGGIWPPFSHKKWEGVFIRAGALIRINTVYVCSYYFRFNFSFLRILLCFSSVIVIQCMVTYRCNFHA